MRGNQKEPIALILAKGKKHLTKEEIEQRESQELKVPITDVEAPNYLTKKQREEFDELAEKLVKLKIFTNLDIDCLTRLILSKNLYLKYTSQLTKEIKNDNYDEMCKLQTLQDKAFRQFQSSARDLGLTPISRCRLIVPDPKDDDDEL